ncbi:MAG: type II toxin-antitoxin system death-on-curing family toxin [Candidatus Aenigmatarchaeota archaeon]
MVYIKYVDEYGPYAYITKREGDRVKSIYIGPISVELANLVGRKSFTREKHRDKDKIIKDFKNLKERIESKGSILKVQTILPETIKNANKKVVEQFGGEEGIINPSSIDYISSAVKTTKGIYKKVARLIIQIIKSHPFLDGNKRTAFLCGSELLDYYRIKLEANPEEIQEFINEIARDNKTFNEVVKWLKERTEQKK